MWLMLKEKQTQRRGKNNLKTQGIDECFMRDYNRRCWPLKVYKMSIELGVG